MFDHTTFEWDENKNKLNQEKHFVSFEEAQLAFFDSKRIIATDRNTVMEKKGIYYCFGK